MGVPRTATADDIRKAYKKRAKLFHPDLHPDDPKAKAKFQALTEANAVLSDPDKRARYDQYGEHWDKVGGFGAGGPGGAGSGFEGFDFSQFNAAGGFSSFFESLFGGLGGMNARRRSRSTRREVVIPDVTFPIDIDIYTALLGGEVMFTLEGKQFKMRVKPGTWDGTKVRLRGKGNLRPDGTRSDAIGTYRISKPILNDAQRAKLEEMRRMG